MQLHRTQNWEDILEEPKWLSEKSIHDSTHFDYPSNSWRCTCKKPRDNNIICWLRQGLWIHTQREGRAKTKAYGLPKETVAAKMMLYRNIKLKVRSPDGDTDYFDFVAGVLQADTLAQYPFIICLEYVLKMSIDKINDNGFKLTKERSRR